MEAHGRHVEDSEATTGAERNGDGREHAREHAEEELHPRLRVLVVEDERLARGALRMILELDGYEVRVTGSGWRALRVLKDFHPQVIIMDWWVTGLSGERLCDAIRRRTPQTPIIVISSSDEAFSSAVEVSARLRKPLDVRRLRAAVAERLPGGRSNAQPGNSLDT